MEPSTIDLPRELNAPHHEGVYGPLLWVDVATARVWREGSTGHGTPELGTGTNALMTWVGMLVVTVSEGVPEERLQPMSEALRNYLGRPDAAVVFRCSWLPEKVGSKIVTVAPGAVPARELARAEGYALAQAAWLDREQLRVELGTEAFDFDVLSTPDEAGRLRVVIK